MKIATVISTANHALVITGLVFMMMLLVEYLNILSRGVLIRVLRRGGWRTYLLAVLLGAVPGCLGSFAVVTLYEHDIISMGAVIATMIATSGDEAFVMLATIPRTFAILTAVLIVVAIMAGLLVDWVLQHQRRGIPSRADVYELHGEECQCYPRGLILQQWRECSLARATLAAILGFFIVQLVRGAVGPAEWNWMRVTLLLTSAGGLFIIATVPEHFLESHLWEHVFKKHMPRVFLWTFGALLLIAIGDQYLHLEQLIRESSLVVLVAAALVGIIPESGPHLMFVTMYAQGLIPFSVLLANSAVQDGHGMLPLLADSRRDFVVVKLVNVAIGLGVGLIVYAVGL